MKMGRINKVTPGLVGTALPLIQALSQFAVLSAVALNFGVAAVGEVSYVNAAIILSFMLFSFGLRNAFVLEATQYGFRTFFITRVIAWVASTVLAFCSVAATTSNLTFVFFALWIVRSSDYVPEVLWAQYQLNGQSTRVLVSQGGRYIVSSAAMIFAATYWSQLDYALAAYAFASAAYALFADYLSTRRIFLADVKPVAIISCVRKFWPLGITLAAMSLQNNGLRLLVGVFVGVAELGMFTIVYQVFIMPSMMFMSALNFYLKASGSTASVARLKRARWAAWTAPVALVLAWYYLGEIILNTFFGPEFGELFFPILALLALSGFRFSAYAKQWHLLQSGAYSAIAGHQLALSAAIVFSSVPLIAYGSLDGAYASLALAALMYFAQMHFLITAKGD